jgi:hypothetical protein
MGELTGTWRGEFYQVGADAMLEGQLTLDIKEDSTYQLVAKRSGRGSVAESGTVTIRGRNALKERQGVLDTSVALQGHGPRHDRPHVRSAHQALRRAGAS